VNKILGADSEFCRFIGRKSGVVKMAEKETQAGQSFVLEARKEAEYQTPKFDMCTQTNFGANAGMQTQLVANLTELQTKPQGKGALAVGEEVGKGVSPTLI
jgi:hypothetical protein